MDIYLRIIEDDSDPCVQLVIDDKEYFFGWIDPSGAVELFNMFKDDLDIFLSNMDTDVDVLDKDTEHTYREFHYSIDVVNDNLKKSLENITTDWKKAFNWGRLYSDTPFLKLR